MATAEANPAPPAAAPGPTAGPTSDIAARKRWTTAEFERLSREGFFPPKGREFLWDGEILLKMPPNPPHRNATANLYDILLGLLSRLDWTIEVEKAVRLSDGWMPEPDLSIAQGPRSRYRSAIPTASDLALIVEVADSTYPDDSGTYLRRYAIEGIPLYWIVHIPERRIEAYSGPVPAEGRYGSRADYPVGSAVPLELTRQDGSAQAFPPIPVENVLRDSIAPPT